MVVPSDALRLRVRDSESKLDYYCRDLTFMAVVGE